MDTMNTTIKIPSLLKPCFENVPGMDNLKKAIAEIYYMQLLTKKRYSFGLADGRNPYRNNLLIAGPKGSGKTSAAHIVGECYHKLGIIEDREPVVTDYQKLLAASATATSENVDNLIKLAANHILLIENIEEFDDNYVYSPGFEMIDTLVRASLQPENNIIIVATGEESGMRKVLKAKSNFAGIFDIPMVVIGEYTEEELIEYAKIIARRMGYVLEPGVEQILAEEYRDRQSEPDFNYLSFFEDRIMEASLNAAARVAVKRIPNELDVSLIKTEDFGVASVQQKDTESLADLMEQLDSLTGLTSVKEQVKQMAAKMRVNQLRKERGLPAQSSPSLHLVFKGNAGTGKTTVARLMGRIYKELGVLSKGQMVECTRSDVVGEYLGQTAIKMRDRIREAMGGVLFIDEAYSLCNGRNDSFGLEAINELVPAMENYRDNLMVIVAGYTAQMDAFLNANQGLRSRFSRQLIFEDYSVAELLEIFDNMLIARGFSLEPGEEMSSLVEELITSCARRPDFGNARGIRNLVEKLSEIQACRLADFMAGGADISDEILQQITKEDIRSLAGDF